MTSLIVIEDDEASMNVLCEFLQIKKLDVVGRGISGKKGIELYERLHPDAVLMDVMMPDFDGFYGLERIKKTDPNAIVVMITADTTKETAEKLMSLGASAVLYKPYDLDKVAPTIEMLIDMKNQSTTSQNTIPGVLSV